VKVEATVMAVALVQPMRVLTHNRPVGWPL
jgi:hypothetical protein